MQFPKVSPALSDCDFPSQVERRQWIRHPCGPEMVCRLAAVGEEPFWALRVQNISPGGIKLVLDRVLEVDEEVTAEVQHRLRGVIYRRRLRVMFSFEDLRGAIIVGADFRPELTEAEFQNLRGHPA